VIRFSRIRTKKPVATDDSRIYTNLDTLSRMEYRAKGFSFNTRQPARSILTGRHASRLRGRGLNFEELRHYRPGDDIRTLDWKVTNRTGKPHVRIYTEERERNVFILVDQRISMFFGTQSAMKSVIAAEIAALIAWRITSLNDRIGGVVFNDSDIYTHAPQRSRRHVLEMLHKIVEFNQKLIAGVQSEAAMLDKALQRISNITKQDSLVILISDGTGWQKTTSDLVRKLSQHNDLIAVNIVDPGEKNLPSMEQLIVSDGDLQIATRTSTHKIQHAFKKTYADRLGEMARELRKHTIPLLIIDTLSPASKQLISAMGGRT